MAHTNLNDKRILIVATDGYERSELRFPLDELKKLGADVIVASLNKNPIKSWDKKDWGDSVDIDIVLKDVSIDEFDGLVLPGGQINPDVLRTKVEVILLIQGFHKSSKIVAAICHAPWLLIEAGLAKDCKMTSYNSIKTDVMNAGGIWEDSEVVVDNKIITSRNPDDLRAFVDTIAKEISRKSDDK
ncbi:type 1 glutamine amidotransferase domain-containing protein [Ochrobactrum quorumnocens]|uniref:type 1 glutamine amidotransferase domain-containing protein n=1 Tax=Ochrobactrum quorumnocens TaxID=271865 RepID=UPI00385192EE